MSELRAQVTEAVKARRTRKAKTRANQKSSKQLENCLEQERIRKLGASTARFAVSPEESDEEKANRKREINIENLARCNMKRSKKRKEQWERHSKLEESSGRRNRTHR